MTPLQECKDTVAQKHGIDDWGELMKLNVIHINDQDLLDLPMINYYNEAAELYMTTNREEHSREVAMKLKATLIDVVCRYMVLHDLRNTEVLKALKSELEATPIPEFKP